MKAPSNGQPATKKDLSELEARLEGKIEAVEGKIEAVEGKIEAVEGKIEAVEGKIEGLRQEFLQSQNQMLEKLQEMIRDVQTEILRGLQVFAGSLDTRMRRIESSDAGVNERVANVESRLFEIEKKLMLRPPSSG